MRSFKISNMFIFDRFRPIFSRATNDILPRKLNLNAHFKFFNTQSNTWNRFYNSQNVISKNNSEWSKGGFDFEQYKNSFKSLFCAAGLSYTYCMGNDNIDNELEREEKLENTDVELVSTENETPVFDPFEDKNVIYYHKKFTYESPSKDSKYFFEIKRYRHPSTETVLPETLDKIRDEIGDDFDSVDKDHFESFFRSPFYVKFKRIMSHHLNDFESVKPVVYSNGEESKKERARSEPFWVVLTKTAPAFFSNAFIAVCGSVFALWKIAENTVSQKFTDFMSNHFVASYEAIKAKRYHTLITSAISHTSFLHFGLNCMFFHQLMKTFQNNMAFQTAPVNSTIQSFARSFFSANHIFPGSYSAKTKKAGAVNTNDIFNVLLLSAILSSLGHVLMYKTPVVGASGAISGLMYLLASTFPNTYFKTVFPLPGMNLSILQIGQLFVATNLYFLMYVKGSNIAWAAHLFGMAGGALYCLFQQYVNKRPGFYNPILLSIKTAKGQWKRTFHRFFKNVN
ncbi:integral membrane protein [Theileria orientalis]|uniref:Integral membrane protein n=1 Tax=Theileria orientalis TaxID=68886 RepID=A0A976QRA3_THEOR|nr:integral membrane protein [Theileria orientalis]